MNKVFRVIGILSLLVFGFFYTEKATTVMKDMDDIMIEVKTVSNHYKKSPIEASLRGNDFIPGLIGREVDINKSYLNMKRVGRFDESLLTYKDVFPKKRFQKNYKNYIIGGNPQKNMVSLIVLVEKYTNNNDLKKMLEIALIKKTKLTFFIDGYWFEENNDLVNEMVKQGHELGNLSYNYNYQDSSFVWMDTIMKKLTHKRFSYCYSKKDNEENLNMCSMYKNYTIKSSLSVSENPYRVIKKEARAGALIEIPVSKVIVEELPSIITYLGTKGFTISTLPEHLKENK